MEHKIDTELIEEIKAISPRQCSNLNSIYNEENLGFMVTGPGWR